ncbi:MAG TPA: ABC transporter permease [Kofleriaceae bacterium]|jgi:ABC-2 type transport system permease protein
MIGAAIVKEVQLLLHDRGRLISLFALPVIFILVFGSMFSFGPDRGEPQSIAIWHEPGDARGVAIERALAATPGFAAKAEPSADAVRHEVATQGVNAGLIVPAQGIVELSIDLGAPLQVRGPLQGALAGVVVRALSPPSAMTGPPIEAVTPPGLSKPLDDISGFQVTVPGNAVLFGFFIAMAVAISFASERHTGTWRRLLASPVPRWQALLGKLFPYFLISIVQLAFLFGIGAAVFHMRVAGSVAALALVSLAVSLCAVSFGMLVASFGGTEKQIGSIVPVVLLVMGLIGGCMFPRILMPPAMKQIGLAVPHSWALDAYTDLLIRTGTGIAQVATPIAAIVGFAVVFGGLGLWRFRFER